MALSRAGELEILYAVAEMLNGAVDVHQALEGTLDRLAELLGLQTGWIWLVDPETGRYYKAAERNLPPFLREPVHMTGEPCLCLDQFRRGQLEPRTVGVLQCSRLALAGRRGSTGGLAYHASIPIHFGDRPLGVINLASATRPRLQPEELRLLSAVASQLGTALERARLGAEAARTARLEERARLSRELHDTLAQGLTAVGLQLDSALSRLPEQPEAARDRLRRARRLVEESLDEARRAVRALRPEVLEGRRLPEALAALARRFTAETGIAVELQARGEPTLSPALEDHLYRIAQEALANVRRHARARQVAMRLEAGKTVRLRIADDGIGIEGPEGYGLQGMRERARLLGGRLQVRRHPRGGTVVSVSLPGDGS